MSESNLTYNSQLGTPLLTLSDGGEATFTGSSGNQLTFAYVVGANDHSTDLTVTGVEQVISGATPTPAVFTDAQGYTANFSNAVNDATGLKIGPPLYVASLSTSITGEADSGETVQLFLEMNQAVTISGGTPSLTLSNNATATYDAAASDLADGDIAFDYLVAQNAHSPDLEITSVNNGTTIKNSQSQAANFSAALNTPTSLQIGSSPLTVSSVEATQTTYDAQPVITFTLTMSEAVANGSARLTLNNGEVANFVAGSQ